jgi:hypothetical protein
MSDTLVTSLLTQYGPIAFGLVVLLVLWRYIVRPEREAVQRMLISVQLITDTAGTAADTALNAARASESAARLLHSVLSRLEHPPHVSPSR